MVLAALLILFAAAALWLWVRGTDSQEWRERQRSYDDRPPATPDSEQPQPDNNKEYHA